MIVLFGVFLETFAKYENEIVDQVTLARFVLLVLFLLLMRLLRSIFVFEKRHIDVACAM